MDDIENIEVGKPLWIRGPNESDIIIIDLGEF